MTGSQNFVVRLQIGLKICVMRGSNHLNNSLSLSTAKALIRTLRCQASLTEDLFDDRYDFILTARFQSDPLERRFDQYRQMSGGRFLVDLKDTICSEKFPKIKSLLKENIDIDEQIKISCLGEMEAMKIKTVFDSLGISLDTLMLSPDRSCCTYCRLCCKEIFEKNQEKLLL